MTDVEDKPNGHAEGEVELVSPPERVALVPFDLDAFRRGRALWAVNYFVLWPVGLTLAVGLEGDTAVGPLEVKEYPYPEGELLETIDQSKDENQADYEVFLGFVRSRILAMKPDERALALGRYNHHSMVSAEQIIAAAP